jgi:hypothetical protein
MFNDRYEHVGADHCLQHPSSYTGLNINLCATSEIAISIENIKANLNRITRSFALAAGVGNLSTCTSKSTII